MNGSFAVNEIHSALNDRSFAVNEIHSTLNERAFALNQIHSSEKPAPGGGEGE